MNRPKRNIKQVAARDSDTESFHTDTLRLTRYIAALDRYLGIAGFMIPVSWTKKPVKRVMELLYLQGHQFFRFFSKGDLKQLPAFQARLDEDDYTLIIDVEDWVDASSQQGGTCFEKIPQEVLDIAEEASALIYLHGRLWQQELDSINEWEPLMPMALIDYFEPTSSDQDTENDKLIGE